MKISKSPKCPWVSQAQDSKPHFGNCHFEFLNNFFFVIKSSCFPGQPVTHYIEQAGLELKRAVCFFLLSARIGSVYYHVWLKSLFSYSYVYMSMVVCGHLYMSAGAYRIQRGYISRSWSYSYRQFWVTWQRWWNWTQAFERTIGTFPQHTV